MYQANFAGAPRRIASSAMSKSSSSENAADADDDEAEHDRQRAAVAQAQAAGDEDVGDQVDHHQHQDADEGADHPAGELRRDPDGAGLVDHQHAGEDAEGADDRLDDDAREPLLEGLADRAEEHALDRGVGQRGHRVGDRLNEITRPSTRPTRIAGSARPQPVVPGSAQTAAAASTVTRNVMPVLVTTSSIVM